MDNKCRAFTSLEQSEKLAEILPIESADMHYNNASIKGIDYVDGYRAELMDYITAKTMLSKYIINPLFEVIPCWSLAAVLSILPKSARLEKGKVTELYRASLPVELEASDWYINPVDACVELIEKLHELKIL